LAISQAGKENRRNHVPDSPHAAHPEGDGKKIKGFGYFTHE